MRKICWSPGLRPGPRWGSLQRSPWPHSWWGWAPRGALLPPPQEPHLQYCHCACPVCMYTRVWKMHCYFLLNVKHGASQLYWGVQLSSAGTVWVGQSHLEWNSVIYNAKQFQSVERTPLYLTGLDKHVFFRALSKYFWAKISQPPIRITLHYISVSESTFKRLWIYVNLWRYINLILILIWFEHECRLVYAN